jgi:hypothetical protein
MPDGNAKPGTAYIVRQVAQGGNRPRSTEGHDLRRSLPRKWISRMRRAPAGSAGARGLFAAALVLLHAGLAGCTSMSDPDAGAAFVAPGKFDLYTCKEIEERTRTVRQREQELQRLMARAAGGLAGDLVNTIAYRSDYLQARGELKQLADAAADKQCTTQSRWSSERSLF